MGRHHDSSKVSNQEHLSEDQDIICNGTQTVGTEYLKDNLVETLSGDIWKIFGVYVLGLWRVGLFASSHLIRILCTGEGGSDVPQHPTTSRSIEHPHPHQNSLLPVTTPSSLHQLAAMCFPWLDFKFP